MLKNILCALSLMLIGVTAQPHSASAENQQVARINVSRLMVFPDTGQFFSVPRVPEIILPYSVITQKALNQENLVRTICVPKEPKSVCFDISITPKILDLVGKQIQNVKDFCLTPGETCGGGTTMFFTIDDDNITMKEVGENGEFTAKLFGGTVRCEIDVSI